MPKANVDNETINRKWRMTCLLDTYGTMLNEHQMHICRMYYDEDMSLSEIAQQESVTRQGVHGALQRAERQLEHFEQSFGLWAHERALYERIEKVAEALEQEDTALAVSDARELIRGILTDAVLGEE